MKSTQLFVREVYDFRVIEKKWQAYWNKNSIYKTSEFPNKKYYILEMYPYPSGDLHMGQFRNYVLGDTIARFKLMQGYDCLHPFGWDAFGLPAENAAIHRGISPYDWTMNNINISRTTLKLMGISYDWNREIITSEPDYYKWTQWLFLKLYERGLAYRKEAYVNWCPNCQTTLANEQVKDGLCERCDTPIIKKELTQWFFKITAYAERLLRNLDKLTEWPEQVKTLQRHWIGRSEGVEIDFEYAGSKIPVFTTRADTIYGVTFIAISPADELARELKTNNTKVKSYIDEALRKTEIERTKSKDGIFTGEYAINPLSGDKVPIWIADYVLPGYGTGVIMGVPAHDERDFEFAKTHNLPIRKVINSSIEDVECPYTGEGVIVNSGPFTGLTSEQGRKEIAKYLTQAQIGRAKVNYRIKDWLISRQRYWGAPIPIIYCPNCNIVPVPMDQLPVRLPTHVDFIPKGKSPLSTAQEFINTQCPKCGAKATRDSDTMDTFVDSSWYWLRYLDPHNKEKPFSHLEWLPIDEYMGGIEHATGHLIYFRFISHFLYDEGLIPYEEPCIKLFTHGMIMDEHGKVMSKSRGNAIPVGPFVNEWGADAARITILFIGPPAQDVAWSNRGVIGASRFLSRVYNLCEYNLCEKLNFNGGNKTLLYRSINQTIKKVTHCLEHLNQNTAIASLMALTNELYKAKDDPWFGYGVKVLVQLLAPFAPHLAEELWIEKLGNKESVFKSKWPEWEEIEEEEVTVIVEVNGRVRGKITLPKDTPVEQVKERALQIQNVANRVKGGEKIVFIPNKLINFISEG